jgi:heptosyltransferase-1
MSSESSLNTNFERILIVRLSSMGDVIHTLPSTALLRNAFPHATLGWLIEERWAELLCTLATPRSGARSPQRPLVDVVHAVNLKRWRRSLLSTQTWERIAAGLSDLRGMQYQAAVDLQGAVRSSVLARWSGASSIFGSTNPRENIASVYYTRKVITQGRHVVERYCEVAAALSGSSLLIPSAILPCDPVAEELVEKRLAERDIVAFAIFSPGAGWGAKQWPAERYGDVARALRQQGLKSIVNYGPREESLAKTVEAASAGSAVAMSFSISELVALTRRARLFVGGDSGPMHLAAALHIPVVAIFGPTDPVRNGPFRTPSIVLRDAKSPTTLTHRDRPDPGLLEITADQVVAAARRLLESTRG